MLSPCPALRPLVVTFVALGFALTAGGCADEVVLDAAPSTASVLDLVCDGPTPICQTSCSDVTPVGQARCGSHKWVCDAGVRPANCCDTELRPEKCDRMSGDCSADTLCDLGYTCVRTSTYPVPATNGVCMLGNLNAPDWVASCGPEGVSGSEVAWLHGTGAIKVQGLVSIEQECENRTCTPADPCCQMCTGSYRITVEPQGSSGGDSVLSESEIVLPIRNEIVSCAGDNCNFSCGPIHPGRRVQVWGTYIPNEVFGVAGTLFYMGHCDL